MIDVPMAHADAWAKLQVIYGIAGFVVLGILWLVWWPRETEPRGKDAARRRRP